MKNINRSNGIHIVFSSRSDDINVLFKCRSCASVFVKAVALYYPLVF